MTVGDGGAPDAEDEASDALRALLRWQDSGGTWELLGVDADGAVIALVTCDGGERVDTLRTAEPDVLAHVRGGPVTYEACDHVSGPFFHGTAAAVPAGVDLVAGRGSNFHAGRVSNHVYFSARLETAVWGAELATALTRSPGRGHVYVVEPLGPFEDDPNVTDKRFPGNPTESYRTRDALRVVREVTDWEGHPPEVLEAMLASLARLREQGLDVIED